MAGMDYNTSTNKSNERVMYSLQAIEAFFVTIVTVCAAIANTLNRLSKNQVLTATDTRLSS